MIAISKKDRKNLYSVPVLMYHSVGPSVPGWRSPWLTTPVDVFQDQIKAMANGGYTAITLDDLYLYMSGEADIPERSVVITLDDGYLDNYVYAFPVLQRHGFKATIFMSTDFTDPSPNSRLTLRDVWERRIPESELPGPGFLSVAEMRLMEQTGVVRIESHTVTHTWYPISPEITDFHAPNSNHPWLIWNERPDLKHGYLSDNQNSLVPYGTPVYKNARSLAGPRFFPDLSLAEHLVRLASADGFFDKSDWKAEMHKKAEDYVRKFGQNGKYETHEQYLERARFELAESKRVLEDVLGREIRFLCWPGGARTPDAEKLALEVGYVSTTKSGSPSGGTPNIPGADPTWIRRIGCQDTWRFRGRGIARTDGRHLLWRLQLFQGKTVYNWPLRIRKAAWLAGSLVSRGRQ
jgi:peptidoglycan/xylan/chitin deacetylase (PgdA/CDA1 family)